MKNHELIKLLSGLPLDAEVFMSSDGEGNSYNPVYEVGSCFVLIDEEDSYQEYQPIYQEDIDDDDEDYSDVGLVEAVYLWP